MSYLGIAQRGEGKSGSTNSIGEDAVRYVSQNQDKIEEGGQFLFDNRAKVFQNISNAQRFYQKNLKKNPKPIRYLTEGEYHLPSMSYCGPGTNLSKYGNFPPYNSVDNACRTHDFAFREAFKLPLGSKEMKEAIRVADTEAVKELDKYPGMYGQKLARTSLALKQRIEDINPTVIKNIVGEAYIGAAKAVEEEKKEAPSKCTGTRRQCLDQTGGVLASELLIDNAMTGIELLPYVIAPIASVLLYAEYKLGKTMYSKYIKDKANSP